MNNSVLVKIARTHLVERKKQSIIAALGVTFGIGTYIILMSFMTGLNGLLDGLILNRTPHIRIYNEVEASKVQPIEMADPFKDSNFVHVVESIKPRRSQASIRNNQGIRLALQKDPRVKGITPIVSARVFYQSGSLLLNGNLMGINAIEQEKLFNFNQYIVGGKPEDLNNSKNGIILGAGVAKKLRLKVGDYVPIITPTGESMRLKIVAFFQSGLAEVDNTQSYANIKTAQLAANEGPSYATDLYIKLKNIDEALPMTREISEAFGVHAVDINTANAQFETGTSIRNLISYAVSITLLIVAGFGIYNILNMLIYEKMNDIAILKAMGFSGGDVKRIFIYQALLIGIIGGAVGLLMGYGVSVLISKAPFETEALPTVKTFPVNFELAFYIGGSLFAIITTFFAGYLPARKASKIDPVEIIRGQ